MEQSACKLRPSPPPLLFSRDELVVAVPIVFLPLVGLYALTMPLTVTFEDSGGFLTTAYHLGIAHPPGYPLFTILGHAFAWLPWGTPAIRIHCLSMLAGAGACMFMYGIARAWGMLRGVACSAALAFGCSRLLWFQATIAEVYALNALLFFGLLYGALRLARDFTSTRIRIWFFLFGLSFTNHWPLMALATPALFCCLWPVRNRWRESVTPAVGFFVLGLLLYGYVPLRSMFTNEYLYVGPVTSLAEFFDYITRAIYRSLDMQLTATAQDSFYFIGHFVTSLPQQLGWVGIGLVVGGLALGVTRLAMSSYLGLVLAALSSSVILKFFQYNDFDDLRAEAYMAYQLIPIGSLTLLAAVALQFGYERMSRVRIAWVVVMVVFPVAHGVSNYTVSQRRHDTMAYDFARLVLESLPPGAHLILYGDTDTGPIVYAHSVTGIRPDVTLHSEYGFLFGNRLFDMRVVDKDQIARANIALVRQHQPVFTTGKFRSLRGRVPKDFDFQYNGLYYRVGAGLRPWNSGSTLVNPILRLVESYTDDVIAGPWKYHRGGILSRYCNVLVLQDVEHSLFDRSVHCKLIKARHLQNRGDHEGAATLFSEVLSGRRFLTKGEWHRMVLSSLLNRLTVLNQTPGPNRKQAFQQFVDEYVEHVWRLPYCGNKVLASLFQIRAQIDVKLPISKLREKFGHCRGFKKHLLPSGRVT